MEILHACTIETFVKKKLSFKDLIGHCMTDGYYLQYLLQ